MVHRDPLVVAVRDGLHLDELAVRVVRRSLRHRGHRVRRDAHPGRAADVDALLERVRAEVLAPRITPDRDVDRVRERIDAERAVAAIDERPDVAGLEAVRAHDLERRLAELLERVRDRHAVDLRGPEEPVEMVVEPEDRRSAGRVVATFTLEDAGAVVKGVREDGDLRVREIHQLPVHPDLLDVLEAHGALRRRSVGILSETVDAAAIDSGGIDQLRQRHDHGGLEAEDAGAEERSEEHLFLRIGGFRPE